MNSTICIIWLSFSNKNSAKIVKKKNFYCYFFSSIHKKMNKVPLHYITSTTTTTTTSTPKIYHLFIINRSRNLFKKHTHKVKK